mgnify:CR=1 FL=1
MPDRTQDRFGMTLSTSSTASVDAWQDGIDRLLSQNHGPDLKFQEAIDLDEGGDGGCCGLFRKSRPVHRSWRVLNPDISNA